MTVPDLRTPDGTGVVPVRLVGSGGQGQVWSTGTPGTAFKRYRPEAVLADRTLRPRLGAMLALPAPSPRPDGRPVLAWPTALVLDQQRLVGFTMPLVDLGATAELHEATNPADRLLHPWLRGWEFPHLLTAAADLAAVVAVLHARDVVVGDFNESNVLLWPDGAVTFLDCDSFQVPDPAGGPPFLCVVGRPEYTAPELFGTDWTGTPRSASSDLYALAVHVHQLLLNGEHPFRGFWTGPGERPEPGELVRRGLWTYGGSGLLQPRPLAPSLDAVGPEVATLLHDALVAGGQDATVRPSASRWNQVLTELAGRLTTCPEGHSHPAAAASCPWCERAARPRTVQPAAARADRTVPRPPPRAPAQAVPVPRRQPPGGWAPPTGPPLGVRLPGPRPSWWNRQIPVDAALRAFVRRRPALVAGLAAAAVTLVGVGVSQDGEDPALFHHLFLGVQKPFLRVLNDPASTVALLETGIGAAAGLVVGLGTVLVRRRKVAEAASVAIAIVFAVAILGGLEIRREYRDRAQSPTLTIAQAQRSACQRLLKGPTPALVCLEPGASGQTLEIYRLGPSYPELLSSTPLRTTAQIVMLLPQTVGVSTVGMVVNDDQVSRYAPDGSLTWSRRLDSRPVVVTAGTQLGITCGGGTRLTLSQVSGNPVGASPATCP